MTQLKVAVNKLNKRKAIPAALPEPTGIAGIVFRDYIFEGQLHTTNALGAWYVDRDNNYYWGNGLLIAAATAATPATAAATAPAVTAPVAPPPVHAAPKDIPINQKQCDTCTNWMREHFADPFTKAVADTPFDVDLLYAIACQETAVYWLSWINDHTADEILARCVFDASGDVDHNRSAFPKNTADFIGRFGHKAADLLIAEANATRALRGFGPKQWVYAGYGIFQYDLQYYIPDPDFFKLKQWYSIDNCLDRALKELKEKWAAHPNDLFATVKAYNGSGPAAENYANCVLQFLNWIKANPPATT